MAAVDFEKQVAPIFSSHCYGCHGPDKQKGQLRLDSPRAILKGGDSGEPLFITGNSADSHLINLVSRIDPDEAMPPPSQDDVLTDPEMQILRDWIDAGAVMPLPADINSAPTTDHWSFQKVVRHEVQAPDDGNEIDVFVEKRLLASELTMSEQANRSTLIRRLYLTMHGMPPSPDAVAAFHSDDSPEAWEKLVDRVLESPRFGERWARHWLDIVRFAESNGFETNRERPNAYHFRDYVIASFNSDKPYDQFVREQIAGDAYGADVGTGFLVAGPYDIVKSPDINLTLMQRQDELADMVNTTGTTFLGLTLGCARCHNHKFDPISQKDFYAFQAIFAGVSYGDRLIERAASRPDRLRLDEMRKAVADAKAELDQLKLTAAGKPKADSKPRAPVDPKLNREKFTEVEARLVRFTIRATNGSQPCIDELVVLDSDGENIARIAVATSSSNLPGYAIHKLEHINDGKFGNSHSWISNEAGKGWVQLSFGETRRISRIEWSRDREGKFSDRLATDYSIEASIDGKSWIGLASSADRQPFGGDSTPNAFLERLPQQEAIRARHLIAETAELESKISSIENRSKAWVANFKQPGNTHRLYRGDPLAKREVVAPDVLQVMGSLGLDRKSPEQQRRTAAADWIASKENPLTARVMVNRLWQFTFGSGLVDTPSDFGANGTLPSHPELLDWLASEFVAEGWSTKYMLRLMLNSRTFQQSSVPRPAPAQVDAQSRLLWRFPPRRLEAEAIRDSILSASGALDLKNTAGPGFYLLDVDRENVVHYHPKEEIGPAEWRRMIYMSKIRQEQDAVFGAFDCPDGNQTIPRRSQSTTPLQALNLFNSQFALQQSHLLSERLKKLPDPIHHAFELLYARAPSREEISDSEGFIHAHGLESFCRAMLNSNEFLFIF